MSTNSIIIRVFKGKQRYFCTQFVYMITNWIFGFYSIKKKNYTFASIYWDIITNNYLIITI